MDMEKTFREKLGNSFALLMIIGSGLLILKWKDYETNVLASANQEVKDIPIIKKNEKSPEMLARISLLKKMAIKEREKIKVMVEHDSSPLTSTYPMILDD